VSFDATPESHGLQKGHDMAYVQWQKDASGALAKQLVWPPEAATSKAVLLDRK
jgi:hypothetical protein